MAEPTGHLGWRQSREGRARAGRRSAAVRLSPANIDPALASRLTYLIIALYALTFAVLSIFQHDSFNTHAFDLGNMDQALWNTSQGRWFVFTNWEGGTSRLAAHVEPILLLIAPLYRLCASPKTLLVLQAVVLSLGALPAFWLARDRLGHPFAGVAFAAVYLLSPALEMANLADFHPVSLSSTFLLFAFYFIVEERYLLFLLAALLAMATKEQVPLTVALLGLYIAWWQGNRPWGLTTLGIALAWLLVAFLIVLPTFNPSGASPYLSRYDYLGASPREIILSLLLSPGTVLRSLLEPAKVEYVQSLFEPVAYASFLSPLVVFTLPDLAINLLSNFPEMYAGNAHYGAVIVPFVVVSAIYGIWLPVQLLRRFSARAAQALLCLLCLVVLLFSLVSYYRAVFLPLVDHVPRVDDHDRLAGQFIALIPPEAAVCTSSALNPHLSHRRGVYLFGVKDPEQPNELYCVSRSDYILLDVTSTPYPIDAPEQRWRVGELLAGGEWGIAAAQDGYLLLRRGAGPAAIPDAFYGFVRAPAKEVSPQSEIDFGGELRFLGYRLSPSGPLHGRHPYAQATLYFQALRPSLERYLIALFVVGDDGHREVRAYHAVTTWYPTDRWPVGETMRVVVDRLSLQPRSSAKVLLSVVAGKDPGDVGARLRPWRGDGIPVGTDNLVELTTLRAE